MREISMQIAIASVCFSLLPCVVAILKRYSSIWVHQMLRILVWGAALASISSIILALIFHLNNLFILHIYTIFDLVLLSLIFKPYIGKKAVWIITVGFGLFAGVNSIFIEEFNSFNVLSRSLEAFIIMCYALIFFLGTLKRLDIEHLPSSPMVWISCGVLLYYGASFFIFLFSRDLTPYDNLWYLYWGIHAIFTIFLYIFYTIALWVHPQR